MRWTVSKVFALPVCIFFVCSGARGAANECANLNRTDRNLLEQVLRDPRIPSDVPITSGPFQDRVAAVPCAWMLAQGCPADHPEPLCEKLKPVVEFPTGLMAALRANLPVCDYRDRADQLAAVHGNRLARTQWCLEAIEAGGSNCMKANFPTLARTFAFATDIRGGIRSSWIITALRAMMHERYSGEAGWLKRLPKSRSSYYEDMRWATIAVITRDRRLFARVIAKGDYSAQQFAIPFAMKLFPNMNWRAEAKQRGASQDRLRLIESYEKRFQNPQNLAGYTQDLANHCATR